MRIAVVDDEKIWQEKIEKSIRQFTKINVEEIIVFHSGEEFLEDNSEFEVVFMDVEMAGLDGFTTIEEHKRYHSKTKYIITTTHTELSRQGYKVEAFRYLDKLDIENEIKEALEAVALLVQQNKTISIEMEEGGRQEVRLKDIIYFETLNRKLLVHIITGTYMCKGNVSSFEEKLKKENFYLCHRSFLINLKYIERIDSSDILMKNGKKVLLSRRKNTELKEKFYNYKFSQANR